MDQVSLERRDGDRPPPLYTKAPHLTGIKRHVTFTRAFTIIATLTQKQHVIFGCVFRSRPREMGISLGKGGAWQRGGIRAYNLHASDTGLGQNKGQGGRRGMVDG